MAITGEEIHSFQYIDYDIKNPPARVVNYLLKALGSIESKHVANFQDNTKIFFEYSEKVGYPNTILGIHRNAKIEDEYFRINNMAQSTCNRAVRFMISKDGRIWSDNTHWTLAYLLHRGDTTLVSDIPAYIIDFREKIPTIYDKDGVVFDSIYDIKSAIASAKRIQERLDLGWRPFDVSYTIKHLQLDILSLIN